MSAASANASIRVDLLDLLASLDSDDVKLLGRLPSRSVVITDVLILDNAEADLISSGTVVLAVGVSPAENDAARLIEHAGERGAAAVVFRTDRPLPDWIEERAATLEVAVLGVPPDLMWTHVYSMLHIAITTTDIEFSAEASIPRSDLFALAEAIAVAVGNPVMIHDERFTVLAYSNLDYEIDPARRQAILTRVSTRPRYIHDDEYTRALRSGATVLRFEQKPGMAPRLAAPVRAGSAVLGAITVAEVNGPVGLAAQRELVHAAQLATIPLLNYRASEDIRHRIRGGRVRDVLDGRTPGRAHVQGPFTVLVFFVDSARDPWPGVNPERVLSFVSLQCEARHPQAMCALIDEYIWVVLPTPNRNDSAGPINLAAMIIEKAETSIEIGLAAAIGTTVPSIADVPDSRKAAERALRVLHHRASHSRLVHVADVWAEAARLDVVAWASERADFPTEKLRRLIDHDRDHDTSYELTLRAYLMTGDTQTAAQQLSVHPRTVRYRLKRIVEISKIDLDDPDERLVTEIALRVLGDLKSNAAGFDDASRVPSAR